MRKKLIVFFTFLGGLYFFLEFVTPKYLPLSVPTMYRFAKVGAEHGGVKVNDTTLTFEKASSAVAACRELDMEFDIPPLLTDRRVTATWTKEGKLTGRIGAALSVEAGAGDPASLPGWTLEPGFWSREYRTYENVRTFLDVCREAGGREREVKDGYGAQFDSTAEALAAARELGLDVVPAPATLDRLARLTRFEQGRLIAEVERRDGDDEALFEGWKPGKRLWKSAQLAHPFFMLGGQHETFSNVLVVVSAAALFLGLINVLRVHGVRVVMRRKSWGYSSALLIAMVAMIVAGFLDWHNDVAGRKAKEFEARAIAHAHVAAVEVWEQEGRAGKRPTTEEVSSLEALGAELVAEKKAIGPGPCTKHGSHFYKDTLMGLGGLFVGLASALFSLLALYIAAAAYRAFRIKSGEAALMMFAALLVMLGQIPMGVAMCNPLFKALGISGGIVGTRAWIMEVINTAAFRGIFFGAQVAYVAIGVRMWLSIQTKSFYKEDPE